MMSFGNLGTCPLTLDSCIFASVFVQFLSVLYFYSQRLQMEYKMLNYVKKY